MIKGTTPTHIFELPFDTGNLAEVLIVYAQKGEEVLRKVTEDVTFDGCKISLKLTQEETFLFDERKSVQIQVRALTNDGDALASQISVVRVEQCLCEEVI